MALAEAALVMLLLCLVTLGAIQYGWFFYCLHAVTNAARQGARVQATLDAPDGAGQTAVTNALNAVFGSSGAAQITVSFLDADTMQKRVSVSVLVSSSPTNPLLRPKVRLLPLSLWPVPDCKATVIMAKEGEG